MTVRQLISKLNKLPERKKELEVYVYDCEIGGIFSIGAIDATISDRVDLNIDTSGNSSEDFDHADS